MTTAVFDQARRVADAVLYEGYVLYPYRASATKNQVRWQFGVLAPRPSSEADGSEDWAMQTECVVELSPAARLQVEVRALQVQARTVERATSPGFAPVDALEVDGQRWTTWEEAVAHSVEVAVDDLTPPCTLERAFSLPAGRTVEDLGGLGRIVRQRWPLAGVVRVALEPVPGPYRLARLRVAVENHTDWGPARARRAEVVRHSLVSVHTLLHVDGGSFVSPVDPPEFARAAVASCANVGTWPVLMGGVDDHDTVLSAPIILPEHPEVAPESAGDLYDATEIDEILSLRILTLTEEEKREARATDARAAAIVDRVDDLPPEVFERLHGAVRSFAPAPSTPTPAPPTADAPDGGGLSVEQLAWWQETVDAAVNPWQDSVRVGDVEVAKGVAVRLHPNRRADAQDLFVVERTAVVAGVFSDVDGEWHVAVVLDDDPGADLHQWHGRFLYFRPDELEVLA